METKIETQNTGITKEVNGQKYTIFENDNKKMVLSKEYNYAFNKQTGEFMRWGKTLADDPKMSSFGPEIADIEISSGKCHNNCPFCYKANRADGKLHNMTLEDYKGVLSVLNQSGILTQVALGITSPDDNPDFIKIMEYTREQGIIPNYTCNGTDMTPELAKETVRLCGAIAISVNDKEKSYDSVKMLTDAGMKQINFHVVAHNKSYDKILDIMEDIKTDKRLKGLNALVLLKYKPKGTNAGMFKPLTQEQYSNIFKIAQKKGVRLGFDSCSAHSYLQAIKGQPNEKQMAMYAEPCESSVFSIYVNSHSEVSPCSFCENEVRDNGENWVNGINLLEDGFNLIEDLWYNSRINSFRDKLENNCRRCPMFDI